MKIGYINSLLGLFVIQRVSMYVYRSEMYFFLFHFDAAGQIVFGWCIVFNFEKLSISFVTQ